MMMMMIMSKFVKRVKTIFLYKIFILPPMGLAPVPTPSKWRPLVSKLDRRRQRKLLRSILNYWNALFSYITQSGAFRSGPYPCSQIFGASVHSCRSAYFTTAFLVLLLLEPSISLIHASKTNKFNNCSFSSLIMYGSSYMFRYYIAIFRECS
jgi:hypothetical protein